MLSKNTSPPPNNSQQKFSQSSTYSCALINLKSSFTPQTKTNFTLHIIKLKGPKNLKLTVQYPILIKLAILEYIADKKFVAKHKNAYVLP